MNHNESLSMSVMISHVISWYDSDNDHCSCWCFSPITPGHQHPQYIHWLTRITKMAASVDNTLRTFFFFFFFWKSLSHEIFNGIFVFLAVGLEASRYIESGALVPDTVMVELIVQELRGLKDTSWLLDGRYSHYSVLPLSVVTWSVSSKVLK